jgi:hypothetical protein
MTTFTLQDLTINNLPTTPEEDEAMDALAKLGGGVALNEMFTQMGKDLANHEIAHQQAQQARLDAVPQPSAEVLHNIGDIINTICTQLQLLATVINQPKAQPEGAQESLQETVKLVLQQGDWFKDMVRETIVNEVSLEDVMKDIVKDEIESEVDTYFRNEFDPTYHFDFGDAVSSEVSDQLDDVVRDRLDEVVAEQLEEVVAEKLKSIRVVFD